MNILFLQNKYSSTYYNIINKAKSRNLITRKQAKEALGYPELHHIIPKCLGGNNSQKNTVFLTVREHFICHKLLVEMVTAQAKYKMFEAVAIFSNNKDRKLRLTSRDIALIRQANAVASSNRNKGNQYYKCRKPITNSLKILRSNNATISRWVNNSIIEKFTHEYLYLIDYCNYVYGRLPFAIDAKINMGLAQIGKKHSIESKAKISAAHKGKLKSAEHKQNLSIAKRNAPKILCEHCGKLTSATNNKRWHGPNCKLFKN